MAIPNVTPVTAGLKKLGNAFTWIGNKTKKRLPKLSQRASYRGARLRRKSAQVAFTPDKVSPGLRKASDLSKRAETALQNPTVKRNVKISAGAAGAIGAYKLGQRRERKKHGNRYNREE